LGGCKVFGAVKNRIFIIAVVLSAALCWQAGWSIENPGIGNPVGPSTIPPSALSSALVNSPTQIDDSGNLLITGNVRRGRQFRGDVPYQSPTSFGASLGSSALSSFLRDSAGPEDLTTYYNKYGTQPYYSPSETVTTMLPGRSEILMPESTRAATRAQQDTRSEAVDVFGLEPMQQEQTLSDRGAAITYSGMQGATAQYGPLAQSQLMPESKLGSQTPSFEFGIPFQTNLSPRPRNTEQLQAAQPDMNRQNQTSSVESLSEQIQDLSDRTQSGQWPGLDSATIPGLKQQEKTREQDKSYNFTPQETDTQNLKPNFGMQTPPYNQSGNGKQTTFDHRGISALGRFTPSADLTSQKNPFSLKDTNLPAVKDFQTGHGQTEPNAAGIFDRARGDTSGQAGNSQDWEQRDVLERIRRQLEDLTKTLDAASQSQGPLTQRRDIYKDINIDTATKRQEKLLQYQPYISEAGSQKISSPLDELTQQRNFNPSTTPGTGFQLPIGESGFQNREPKIVNRQSGISYDSLSQSKFDQKMRDAEGYMKAGRYYRAASSFSLASIYQPDNPLALAGRGHALFAAGEYVSSALSISRALAISPEYLQTRVDLADMLGGENKLAGRIADLEHCLARSGSSQFQFLLGYVYYRTGRLLEAKKAIDAVYEKTPESPAVRVMKSTIDNMLMHQ
jgi:tetratricopeptide (TPR) repeat protein